mmetsp:Transcript_11230/g.23641  ORF Transcript_11230/g.23641 Transcript_11230/m.23641 type:complete len:197 (+) Transcript_11230:190-780(+)
MYIHLSDGERILMAAHLCAEGDWSCLPTKLLFRAMKDRDAAELRTLFNDPRHIGEADCIDGDGCCLLHLLSLIHVDDVEVASELVKIVVVENGGNVDMHHCRRGETPLMVAVLRGNCNVVKALVGIGGADPIGHVDWKGRSVVDMAREEAESCRNMSDRDKEEARSREMILNCVEEAAKKSSDLLSTRRKFTSNRK